MHVILNYGMGVDSTAILTRWLRDPQSHDFTWADLIVLTAQTGDEFADVRAPVETFVLPQLRARRIRYVQVARAGPRVADGIAVLDDSRAPRRLCLEGAYTLGQELLAAGTVPQVASRRCSAKAKGVPNDAWIAANIRGPFRQVMGFNADESYRIERDGCYGGNNRHAEYPLMVWSWGRTRCEEYLRDCYGVAWPKSCCAFCPFTGGRPHVLARYAALPQDAAAALYLERLALALNPHMTLFASGSLAVALLADGHDHTEAFRLLEARLNAVPWAVYRVRRVYHARGRADRDVRQLATGSRSACAVHLAALAQQRGLTLVDEAGSQRFWTLRRQGVYPSAEEMFVAAPAEAQDKARQSFGATWGRVRLPLFTHTKLQEDQP
jgi:hypothetical protein